LYNLIAGEFVIISSASIVKNKAATKAIRRCNIPDTVIVSLKTDQHYENPNDLEWEEE